MGRMGEALAHRGPDGAGARELLGPDRMSAGWLGHRRLKVIDLTGAAAQPMRSRSRAAWLVFNGEIYNFRELRRELISLGHGFESTGDTEVVVRAWEQWGDAFVERLSGMWAIAIWDEVAGRLLLSRDPVGKKPLFYAHDGERLTFASEIKALARCPWIRLAPRLELLPHLLTFGYVPWPETLYEGVRQVPPGGTVSFRPADGALVETRHFTGIEAGRERTTRPDALGIRELLEDATRRRMVADVPVGALLSGGIDSSVVTALMTHMRDEPVDTFTVGFADSPSFDERNWAAFVARRLGTRHHEIEVRPDAVALLDHLVWMHDGPFADSSAIPTYLVCELASETVRVVLTGDGGDEAFGGYERFTAAAMAARTPAWLARPGLLAARLLPAERRRGYNSARRRVERFLADASKPLLERYAGWVSVFGADELARIVDRPPDDLLASLRAPYEEAAGLPELDRILHVNMRTYLPDDLAVKVDRASMAHSLELRCPFLDRALLAELATVSATSKVGFRYPKPLLRAACEPLVPGEVWKRRKHGFGVPVDRWLEGELGERFEDEVLADDGRLRALGADAALSRYWREQRDGARHGARLWTLMTLESWLRDLERPQALANASRPGMESNA